MSKTDIIYNIFDIMDKMDMAAEKGEETELQEFKIDDTYSIAVECDILVDHVDWYKVYIKENGEFVENITIYHNSNDTDLYESVNYLLRLRNLGE